MTAGRFRVFRQGDGIGKILLVGQLLGFVSALPCRADDWPEWRGPKRDGVWREPGIRQKFGEDLAKKWSAPIAAGYTGPTVSDGRVYVMDREVTTDILERVLCFDAETGRELWKHTYQCDYGEIGYQAGPRACVTLVGDRAFSLGATGQARCLEAKSGAVVWKKDYQSELQISMPIWGVSASPLPYKDTLILQIGGAPNACVVAVNQSDGAVRWRALSDRAQYSTPILVEQSGKAVVIVWTGDSVVGINPDTGDTYWRRVWKPKNMPIGVATPVIRGNRVFFTSFYDGSLMLELTSEGGQPSYKTLWHRVGTSEQDTDALQSIMSTPVFRDEYIYGVDSYGEMRCLRADNGDRVWEDLTVVPKARWSNIHFVEDGTDPNGERVWLLTEKGIFILAKLTPTGCFPLGKAKLLEPTTDQLRQRGGVCWSHPAFANGHVFLRNDKELVCYSLRE